MADSPRLVALRRRVEADPASTAFAQLADECCRLGRFEEAAECCRNGLAHHPTYLSAHVILARALTELGQFDEAAAEFALVLSSAPDNLSAKRGMAYLDERREASAAGASGASGAERTAGAESTAGAADHLDSPVAPPDSETAAWVVPAPVAASASHASETVDAPEAPDAPGLEAPAAPAPPAPAAEEALTASAVAAADDPLATLESELRAFEEAHRLPPPDPAAEALAELEAWLIALRTPRSGKAAAPRA